MAEAVFQLDRLRIALEGASARNRELEEEVATLQAEPANHDVPARNEAFEEEVAALRAKVAEYEANSHRDVSRTAMAELSALSMTTIHPTR